MLKKTITYMDYNDVERNEDFYFHLNKAEIMEMQLSTDGTLTTYIEEIVKTKDVPKIVEIFKKLILKSYGKKSPDGKRFIKSQEITDEFEQSEAYSELFMELATDAEAGANFVKGIVPKEMQANIEANEAGTPIKLVGEVNE